MTDLVPEAAFMGCFNAFITNDYGTNVQDLLVYNSTVLSTQIVTFKPIRETSFEKGSDIFKDLKTLIETYGLDGTYFFSGTAFLWEGYDLAFESLTLTSLLAFAVVFVLVLIFTANPIVAICVTISVGMEFLFGLAAYMQQTLKQ